MKKTTPAQEAKRKRVTQKRADYTKKRDAAKKAAVAAQNALKKSQASSANT